MDDSKITYDMDEVFKYIYSQGKEGIHLTKKELDGIVTPNVSLAENLFLFIEFKNNKPIIHKPKE